MAHLAKHSDAKRQAPAVGKTQLLLDNEVLLYGLSFLAIVAGCLLIPTFLNNMIFAFLVLLLVVAVAPFWLKRRLRLDASALDRRANDP